MTTPAIATSEEPPRNQAIAMPVHNLYRQLDEDINQQLNIDVGFTALLRAAPYPMDERTLDGFRRRHAPLQRFQQTVCALFKASLDGEADPEIAQSVLADVPAHLAQAYHRRLTERQQRPPFFFRTDEPAAGKLSEIQCPGSGWCLAEELLTLYRNNPEVFGRAQHFGHSLAGGFAHALESQLGRPPVIHHLTDNASRPHGARYFLQRTREYGLKYFGSDRDLGPADCNFVRSHDFITLPHHNFFAERLERCEQGQLWFDLSPSALFDGKIIMAWPFWSKTRAHFDDECRALFPFTSVVSPQGCEWIDGSRLTLDDFCRMPRRQRGYFLKYAGTDIALNWGSKSVFLASTLSKAQCEELARTLLADHACGRRWILQEAVQHSEPVTGLSRDGAMIETMANVKFSGFYGPGGLLGILVMHKAAHKIHGSAGTIMSAVP